MNIHGQRLRELFNRWYNHQTSEGEEQELMDLLKAADEQGELNQLMGEAYEQLKEELFFSSEQKSTISDVILKKKKAPLRIFALRRVAAAAAIIVLLGAGTFLWFIQNSKPGIAKKVDVPITKDPLANDIPAPAGTQAVITLADGRQVSLDSLNKGTLVNVDNVTIKKLADGQITYSGIASELQYNTLTNPRGSKVVNLTLSDGSKVWLNAESSLRYPLAFVGSQRKVEITGEAYFEVAHKAAMPFKVKKGETEVEVLGTHFNINAYTDESILKVTVLEGSVKIVKETAVSILKKGEQAQVSSDPSARPGQVIKVASGIDVNEVMAWKNDRFQFNKANLQEVMRQIARWYDVEISYEGKIAPQLFGGKMQRNLNLSEVLDGLAKSQVHFRIEGRRVVVMP